MDINDLGLQLCGKLANGEKVSSEVKRMLRKGLKMLPDDLTGEDSPYGTLMDYNTNEEIRPATQEEQQDSQEAARFDGGAGVIEVNGRSCYVLN